MQCMRCHYCTHIVLEQGDEAVLCCGYALVHPQAVLCCGYALVVLQPQQIGLELYVYSA